MFFVITIMMQPPKKHKQNKKIIPFLEINTSIQNDPYFKKLYTNIGNEPLNTVSFKTLYDLVYNIGNNYIDTQRKNSTNSNSTQDDHIYSQDIFSKISQLFNKKMNIIGTPIISYTETTKKMINHHENIQQNMFSLRNKINEIIQKQNISSYDVNGVMDVELKKQIATKLNAICQSLTEEGFKNKPSIEYSEHDDNFKYKNTYGKVYVIDVTQIPSYLHDDILQSIEDKISQTSNTINQRKELLIEIAKNLNLNANIERFNSLIDSININDLPNEELGVDINIPEENKNDLEFLKQRIKDQHLQTVSLTKQIEAKEKENKELKEREAGVKRMAKDQEALIQKVNYVENKFSKYKEKTQQEMNELSIAFQNQQTRYNEELQEQQNRITTSKAAKDISILSSTVAALGTSTYLAGNKWLSEYFSKPWVKEGILIGVVVFTVIALISTLCILTIKEEDKVKEEDEVKKINNNEPNITNGENQDVTQTIS